MINSTCGNAELILEPIATRPMTYRAIVLEQNTIADVVVGKLDDVFLVMSTPSQPNIVRYGNWYFRFEAVVEELEAAYEAIFNESL